MSFRLILITHKKICGDSKACQCASNGLLEFVIYLPVQIDGINPLLLVRPENFSIVRVPMAKASVRVGGRVRPRAAVC